MATQTAIATFTGAEDSIALTWTAMPSLYAIEHGVTVTDGGGPVGVQLSSVSSSGATVQPTARFSGTIALTILDR